MNKSKIITAAALLLGMAVAEIPAREYELFNVSYDPTRELYREFNAPLTGASH
jgi:ABC-type sulfate transport system substrate-binding protein